MDRRKFALESAAFALGLLGAPFFEAPALALEPGPPDIQRRRRRTKKTTGAFYRPTGEVLVTIFLRGACDGLNLVPPIAGKDRELYESARPNIQIRRDQLLALDERFGLHPSAGPLHELYVKKKLALVHCAGLTADSRSHFDAQDFMELGTPGKKGTSSGWLARHLEGAKETPGTGFIRAVGVGGFTPLSLLGYDRGVELENPASFNVPGDARQAALYLEALKQSYRGSEGDWLARSASDALEAWKSVSAIIEKAHGAGTDSGDYPKGEIGNHLRATALLLKSGLGIRAAAVDMGGWDTHKNQGAGTEGTFANLVSQLSEAISAFMKEMAGTPVTVLVMTEFGRRLRENASRGTDHGHGSVMMALGEGVQGGKIYGEWAGLGTDRLYDRADLAVTTDYRQVVAEALGNRLGDPRMSLVFPDFQPAPKGLGLFRARAHI